MGPPQDLPPEISSEILAFLTSDTLALSSCSLVSAVWLDETRRYLFRITTVWVAKRTLASFKDLLESSPPLASVIHELRVRGSWEDGTLFPLKDLAAVVSKLPALQDIRLLRSAWLLSSPNPRIPEVHAHSVHTLALTDCPMPDPATLHDIYGWFPNLQNLFFYGPGARQTFSESLPSIPPTLRLRVLRFRTRPYQQSLTLLNALRKTISVDSLEVLDVVINVAFQKAIVAIGDLLSDISQSLRHLTLRFLSERHREQREVVEVWSPLHLNTLKSLETITFVSLFYNNAFVGSGNNMLVPWPHIIHALSLITSPYLTTIKLTIVLLRETPMLPLENPVIVEHLLILQDTVLRLRAVKRVRIVAVDLGTLAIDRDELHPPAGERPLPDEMQARFRQVFPVLHERDMLWFSLEDTT